MLAVTVRITGTQDVINKLKRLDLGLLNFEKPLKTIGSELIDYYEGQVFASQGGALGVKWVALSAKTQAYKRKHYPQYATSPLIRTGQMRYNSFHFSASSNHLTIENSAPYFKYHQSTEARHKIPYRPMMGLNSDTNNIIKNVIKADIKSMIDGI